MCTKMRHCLHSSCRCDVKGFGGGCSPGSTCFFLLATVLHSSLQSPSVWPQLCCPSSAHSDSLVKQLGRAARSHWTRRFSHFCYLFHFHWVSRSFQRTRLPWKAGRTVSFSRQTVGVVTSQNHGRWKKACAQILMSLRLNLSTHFQSQGNAAAMAVLKICRSVSFLGWAGIQTLHLFWERVMFWGCFASLSLPELLQWGV